MKQVVPELAPASTTDIAKPDECIVMRPPVHSAISAHMHSGMPSATCVDLKGTLAMTRYASSTQGCQVCNAQQQSAP